MVVIIIVDGQQVAVDVRVSQQHVGAGDAVEVLEEAVELLEAAGAVPPQGEAPVLGLELEERVTAAGGSTSYKGDTTPPSSTNRTRSSFSPRPATPDLRSSRHVYLHLLLT